MADVQSETSTSLHSHHLCGVCNVHNAIYTCPRCSTRTCSLPCSTKHKTITGCNGERNRIAYVPMNKYGWGTMMNDYVFLEDVGRKVGNWGKEIAKDGFRMRESTKNQSSGNDSRVRYTRTGKRSGADGGNSKRDILKIQLEARDIDMELLPVGMERRKINQSYWETKNHTALLTVEFKFHPPHDPLAPSSQPPGPPFVLLTHKNRIEVPLLSLIQQVTEHAYTRKDGIPPEWVKRFVVPDPEDSSSFTPPQCVMMTQLDPRVVTPSNDKSRTAYYRLDPTKTLLALLRHTHFVEFPTIELWEEFTGTIVDIAGTVTQQPTEERKPKRRKFVAEAGKKALEGLVGGYGSEGGEEETSWNVLSTLGEYGGDDEDHSQPGGGHLVEEHSEGNTEDEVEVDPAILLELMRQARDDEGWAEKIGREDVLDWDDSGEDERV